MMVLVAFIVNRMRLSENDDVGCAEVIYIYGGISIV